MKRVKLAMLVDRVVPALTANFNAAAKLMEFVAIETGARSDFKLPLNCERISFGSSKTLRWFKPEFSKMMRTIRPDVIVTLGWWGVEHLAGLYWGTTNKVPVIVASDSAHYNFPRTRLREAIKRKILSLFSVGWAAGSAAAEYLIELGMERDRVLVGPVDSIDVGHFKSGAARTRTRAAEVRAQLNLPLEYFLSVSRLASEKNIPTILKAYKLYKDEFPKDAWKLVIVGSGPLESNIRQVIQDWGLERDVCLPGQVDFEALPAYYALGGALIHASMKDTWAVVVNEAMAAGLPVIVSAQSGSAKELVAEGCNGFIFDARDPVALAKRLAEIAYGRPDRRLMGYAGQQRIANWAPESYAASLLEATTLARTMPVPRVSMVDKTLLTALIMSRKAAALQPI